MMQNILKIIILVSIALGSVQVFCQEEPSEPVTDEPAVVEEPAAKPESSSEEGTEKTAEKPVEKRSTKPEPAVKRAPAKKSSGLELLDIQDAELIDARIPGIEITERKQIIADIDEPELQTETDVTAKSENSEQVSGQTDTKDSTSKKESGIEKSYHSWNKVAKRWVPRGFIILLLILLIMLYKSKTRKRRRVFRKIPSKRR